MATRVVNCLAYENTLAGIKVSEQDSPEIFQNTAAKNTGDGLVIDATAANAVVKNNISWANTGAELVDNGFATVLSNNLTASDPLFVDQDADDFHLQETSPAIDAGADLSAGGILTDYDGAPRPQEITYDIGAYEWFSESADPPNEGALSSAGVGAFNALGEFLSSESTLSAAGVGAFNALGEFVSVEATLAATGAGTFNAEAQFVIAQTSDNPKTFVLRIREARIGANGIIEFDLVREDLSIYDAVAANPLLGASTAGGSPPPPVDPEDDDSDNSVPGSTRVELLDLPTLRSQDDGPGFYAAASGINDGWAGAILYEKIGGEYIEVAQLGSRAVIGRALTLLPSGVVTLFDAGGRTYQYDDINTVDVELIDGVSQLISVSEAEQEAGVNAIALGVDGRWEIISFGTATELAPRQYRLSHLLRGLKGTEWAAGLHQTGDIMILLDQALRRVEDNLGDLNVARSFRAVSLGNTLESAGDRVFTNTGVSLKPLAPVYHRGEEDGAENRILRWWRRSRIDGLAGRDGTQDPPLGEAAENYEIDILNAAGTAVLRTLTSTSQQVLYTASAQTEDFGSVPSSLRFCVYQLSAPMGRGYAGCAVLSSFAAGTPTEPTDRPYIVCCTLAGKPPSTMRAILHPPPIAMMFPDDFVGSRAVVRVDPLAETVFSIRKNDVEIGTITFAAGNTVGVFASSAAGDIVLDPGSDVISLVCPTQDEDLSDLGVALLGSRL